MSDPVQATIDAVARRIRELWRPTGHDQDRLAEVAATALTEVDLEPLYDPVALIRWIATERSIPSYVKGEADFASPTVTVYRDDHFRIELIVWNRHLPATEHDHTSPGAFAALSGARLHYAYAFDSVSEPQPGLRRGELHHLGPEVLGPGDVRAIPTLDGLIHSIFILDDIATTVAVRSRKVDGAAHIYMWPGIAIADDLLDAGTIKRLQAVQLLRRADPGGFWQHVRELAPGMSASTRLFALLESLDAAPSARDAEGAVRELMAGPEGLEEVALQAVNWRRRRRKIEHALPRVTDPELRFLLGLLWGPAPRARAFALLEERSGGSRPERYIRALADRLSERVGAVLDVPWDEPIPAIFEILLAGIPPAEVPRMLRREYDASDVDALLDEVQAICAGLQGHPIVGCWLDGGRAGQG